MNNLQQRVVSSLVMVVLFGVAVSSHHFGLLFTFGLLTFITSTEYIAMVKPGHRTATPSLLAVALYGAIFYLTDCLPLTYFMGILGLVGLYNIIVLTQILVVNSNRDLRSFSSGVIYLALAASCVHYFQYYEDYQKNLLIILFLVMATDTGSYFVGKYFGKRPLAPSISPNKTIEGFFGGLALSLAFSSVLALLDVISWNVLILACVMHILTVLGDLLESKVKRLTKVKDSSHLIPGHGGFLDRCDGLFFALPFGILVYHYLFKI